MKECNDIRGAVHVDEGDDIGKTLLIFCIPVLISQLMQEMYNAADCSVVGHFGGTAALAATGTGALPLSVIINFFVGFSSGVSAVTARLFGSRDHERLVGIVSSLIRMTIVSGALMGLAMYLSAGYYLDATAVPPDVISSALVYLRICSLGIVAQMINNMTTSILRSVGDTSSPMRCFVLSAVINLIGDVVLVAVLKKGVAGAAAATVASQYLLSFLLLKRMREAMRITVLSGKGSKDREALSILMRSLPAGMQALFMSISSILIRFHINAFGSDVIAGMNVFGRIEGLCYLPSFAFGIALTGFVGQNAGAGKPERIRQSVAVSIRSMIIVMVPLSFLLCLAAPMLAHVFTSKEEIIINAVEAVRYTLPLYAVYAVNQVYLGAVKGMGDTVWPMICTLISYALFRVLWVDILLERFATMKVIYLSYSVSFLLMLVLILPRYLMLYRRTEAQCRDIRSPQI